MSWFLGGAALVTVWGARLVYKRLRDPNTLARAGFHELLRRRLARDPALVHHRSATGDQDTPLHQAAKYGEVEAMRVLLAAGAEVNARDGSGGTPLHAAAAWGEMDAVRLLLTHGAEVNARDACGVIPYHLAGMAEHEDIASALREAGADAEILPVLLQVGDDHWVSPMAERDPAMAAARERAQASLPVLRGLFANSPQDAAVKFPLVTDTGQTEHVWGMLSALDADRFTARIVTPPTSQKGPLQDEVTRSTTDIEDWQVEQRDGSMRGGFGVEVMFSVVRRELGRVPPDFALHEPRYLDWRR